ncbi:hypothetical protein HDR60_01765 [bacterium]|nr:hypothetical protein [bacterium]
MSFDLDKERKIYIKELKNSYDKPEQADVSANRFLDFGRMLIATKNDDLIKNISTLSSFLKKRKFDNFYIPYALFMNYKDTIFDLRDPYYSKILSNKEKEENLKNTISILNNKLDNKNLIDSLYKMIRSGENIDIIYNPEKLKTIIADIEKTQRIALTIKNMSNEK